MFESQRIVAASPASKAILAELTAEVWLNPDVAERFAADRSSCLHAFAAERGYAMPIDFTIDDLELEPSPVGDLDLVVPFHAQATTAELHCNSYDGTCGPTNSFFCVSHNPGSCPSTNFDCPSQTCTAYPCGAQ